MGVYIRGMEMPTSCFYCPCYHHKVDDGYYDYEICRASGTIFNDGYSSVTGHKDHIDPFKARLGNCPLVPVPPHGRLIDGDVAEVIHFTEEDADGKDFYDGILYASDFINKQPTIVPAEEGE